MLPDRIRHLVQLIVGMFSQSPNFPNGKERYPEQMEVPLTDLNVILIIALRKSQFGGNKAALAKMVMPVDDHSNKGLGCG
jgi:hypothetical protein